VNLGLPFRRPIGKRSSAWQPDRSPGKFSD
jgi:hypothetical protein